MSEFDRGLPVAFDNELYLKEQIEAFQDGIDALPHAQTIIEFGGKPFGDHHASRVLPGYDPDNKATLLTRLAHEADARIVMVVNARDVLEEPYGRTPHGRIRGDSGLRYDDETIRLIEESVQDKGIPVEDVVLAVAPHECDEAATEKIRTFATKLAERTGLRLKTLYEVPGYPDPASVADPEAAFSRNDRLSQPGRPLVLVSPGGGSGKFGVALSEAYHLLQAGQIINFIKFETFPVFNLAPEHATNMAFQAATVDLGNEVMLGEDGRTTYDKDDQNFKLLRAIGQLFDGNGDNLARISSPFDFSVNVIERAITDESAILAAGVQEIHRRLQRYIREYRAGDEKLSTVQGAAACLGRLIGAQLVASEQAA